MILRNKQKDITVSWIVGINIVVQHDNLIYTNEVFKT